MSKPEKDDSTANPYKDTLFLPKTEFPMRGGLPQQEPERLKKWEAADLYGQLRADAKKRGAKAFMLHDGPPYANGHIHIGTSMNKILKDLVVRTRQMMGFDADYIPGWDCHGLPIEWKVEEEYRAGGKQKRDVPMAEFRKACRDYAQKWIDIQRTEFKRLGVTGNWNDPYLTMDYSSEAATVREFLKVAMSDQLERGAKPVMYSPVEQTALAEAEVEYADRKATTIWVKFPIFGVRTRSQQGNVSNTSVMMAWRQKGDLWGASVVIWTTTPWTIPANQAISYNPSIDYGLYEVTKMPSADELGFAPWARIGERLVLSDKLADSVRSAAKIKAWRRIRSVEGWEISHVRHPLANPVFATEGSQGHVPEFFDRLAPMLEGSHVTDEVGTGFVHTAPSHGEDDYEAWRVYQSRRHLTPLFYGGPDIEPFRDDDIDTSIHVIVDRFGRYANLVQYFAGLEIIQLEGKKRGEDGPANAAVVKKLIEFGGLLARGQTVVRDAHSWRSKAPVIRVATLQWFIPMDEPLNHLPGKEGKTLRDLCLTAIDSTEFTPERGRQRIRAMVEERPAWLISRQRAWGVPLTLFYDAEKRKILKDPAVNKRIIDAVEKGGADAWFGGEAASFLGNDYDASKYEKINDILDVWFDSGTTHAFTLEDRGYAEKDSKVPPADVYLEGSDQHRGWFQSSLLESCATRGHAPYKAIVTHGFVQAEDGEKMSKSLGNTISPMEVCQKYGADILRIWVASSDYADDPSFGWKLFEANSDGYRKLRNTMRYLLGALDGFSEKERVAYADMPGLERWVLHRLAELSDLVTKAYQAYDFKKAFHELMNFCVVDLSSIYFDIRKDSLYCDAPSSLRRRACRTVMAEVFDRLTIWFAPVMVFTCEEAWEQRYPNKPSVHLQQFPETPSEWGDRELALDWQAIFQLRSVVLGALEIERREKRIGSSLEASIDVFLSGPVHEQLALKRQAGYEAQYTDGNGRVGYAGINRLLADLCITSQAQLNVGQLAPPESFKTEDASTGVVVSRAAGVKCARSWKYFDPKTADPQFPDITPRDAAAVREYRGL